MERKQFLKGLGLFGLGTLIPSTKATAAVNSFVRKMSKEELRNAAICNLSPAVNEGPFYLNLNLLRQDITLNTPNGAISQGIPLQYAFTVLDLNCNPIPNAAVDIWHCDKDGIYSGFSSQGTLGQDFLRGIQMTDINGQCTFTSIYPGWYPNRLTHLHVKIHLNSSVYVTTNNFYPNSINQIVYADPLYSLNGQNPTTVAQDIELHGDMNRYNDLMLNIIPDGNGGYIASPVFIINYVQTGVNEPSTETGGQFSLKQNFPNPFTDKTSIIFNLLQSSQVQIEIYDITGKKVLELANEKLGKGEHQILWDRRSAGYYVSMGTYILQMTVENPSGVFKKSKIMNVN